MHYTDNGSRISSYAFTRVMRSQSTLQRQLRRQIKKTPLCQMHILSFILFVFKNSYGILLNKVKLTQVAKNHLSFATAFFSYF
jgi:hypothetical protein